MRLGARDALAVLHDAGIDHRSMPALAWLFKVVDGCDVDQIAALLGIQPVSVRAYLGRVSRRLRQHHETQGVDLDLDPDADDEPGERLRAEARALLESVANRPAPPDHAADEGRPPLVSVDDACRIIAALAVRRMEARGCCEY